MTEEMKPKYVIFDTDMGGDDAWALQMILKAEKLLKTVKVLAITTINGNTSTDNAIKNTYRILDGVGRNDVIIYSNFAIRKKRFNYILVLDSNLQRGY